MRGKQWQSSPEILLRSSTVNTTSQGAVVRIVWGAVPTIMTTTTRTTTTMTVITKVLNLSIFSFTLITFALDASFSTERRLSDFVVSCECRQRFSQPPSVVIRLLSSCRHLLHRSRSDSRRPLCGPPLVR